MPDATTSPLQKRQEFFQALRRKPEVSVLIIGAGINGAGLFRELALQGVETLLVEKSDYCAGTSAASGRVIHGGIRYLENGEFRLVREALHERNRLLINAPHYVKPLPATIPIYSWASGMLYAIKQFLGLKSKPGDRGLAILKTGLTMYDLLAGQQNSLPRHTIQMRRAALAKRPELNKAIVATATYYDARLTYAERLCLELIQDAESISPVAQALNYVRVQGAAGDTVTLHDEISGESVTVKPHLVVNATGAWIDFTNRAMKRETTFIGGTKGSHLVVDHKGLFEETQGQMLHFVNSDGRITIFYPMGDKVLIGTTDIHVDDPETAVCDQDETTYLLQSVNRVFPNIKLDPSHIVFKFCGVRPLPRSSTMTAGQISRDHSCPVTPPGNGINFPIYSLVGGKWTTFRAFSEQVADKILADLPSQRRVSSRDLPIGGGRGYPLTEQDRQEWINRYQRSSGLPSTRLETLLERYGTRAEALIEFLQAGSDQPLEHLPEYTQREIKYLALNEQVVHIDDLILRRTLIGMLGQLTFELLEELATVVGQALNWTAEDCQREILRTIQLFEQRHGVTLIQPQPAS